MNSMIRLNLDMVVLGLNMVWILSDLNYPVPVLDTGPQENWRYQKIL